MVISQGHKAMAQLSEFCLTWTFCFPRLHMPGTFMFQVFIIKINIFEPVMQERRILYYSKLPRGFAGFNKKFGLSKLLLP